MLRQFSTGILVVLLLIGLGGCGGNPSLSIPPAIAITVSPISASVQAGQTAQFSASVTNASNSNVIWEVNGEVGGDDTIGTITMGGLYTAPQVTPNPATVTIAAAAAANTSMTATATVSILPPVSVAISPTTANILVGGSEQFSATVSNSPNTAVTWQVNGVTGGNATVGTITTAGLYMAPGSVPSTPTVTVTAVSVANPNVTASASVTIQPLPPTVVVSPADVSVPGNTTYQFSATVSNAANTAVTWEVNSIPGGNTTVGTITTSGLYTAPAAIPSPAIVTVSAVLAANPAVSGSANVTITTPEVVTVNPPSVTLQPYETQAFMATSSIAGDTLTWEVNGITGGNPIFGTITQNGLYTAPDSTPTAPTSPIVVVKAVSGINPAIFGSAVVTIGTTPPSVSVSPQSVGVPINRPQQFTATVLPSTLSQAVQWQVNGVQGGSSITGTISNTGLYQAPLLVPSPANVTITAISTAVPISGSATATITLPGSPISVSISPTTAPVIVGQSQQFIPTVSPNNNTAVTWSVSSSTYSCAANACGTISPTGDYTAPTTIPGGGSSATVTVTATSVADPTKSGTAMVTITPMPMPTVTITPSSTTSVTVGATLMFSATVQNVSPTPPINWNLGCITNDGDDATPDYCGDDDAGTPGNEPAPDEDGPGQIAATGGGTPGLTVSDSPSVIYSAPLAIFSPVTPQPTGSLPCPQGTQNGVSGTAYVPLTASITVSGTKYTSAPVCIEVTGP